MAGRKDSQEGPGEHHGAAAGGAKPSLVHHRSVRDSSKTMDEALREAEELAESRQKSFARSMAPVKRGPSIPEFVWRAATQTPATGGVQRDAPGTIFPMPSRQERLAAAEAKLRAKRCACASTRTLCPPPAMSGRLALALARVRAQRAAHPTLDPFPSPPPCPLHNVAVQGAGGAGAGRAVCLGGAAAPPGPPGRPRLHHHRRKHHHSQPRVQHHGRPQHGQRGATPRCAHGAGAQAGERATLAASRG